MNWIADGMDVDRSTLCCLALVVGSIVSLGVHTSAAEPDSTPEATGHVPEYVRSIVTMPFGALDQDMKNSIQLAVRGHEREAVAFALRNIHGDWSSRDQDSIDLDLACVRIITCLQGETLRQFEQALSSAERPSLRLRRALVRWARTSTSHRGLCLTVDSLIQDHDNAEDVDVRMVGVPRRLSDAAYNLAVDRIQDANGVLGKKPIGTRDRRAKRDEKLEAFRSWWTENRAFLEWSASEKKFVVNREAKRTAASGSE